MLSDEEFFILNSKPFEDLTEDEKTQLNFKKLSLMSDEQINHLFESTFISYQNKLNKTE